MKNLTIILLAIALVASGGGPAASAQQYQQPPVTISKEKVRMNGKVYYSHVVQEKQTLFSVAKAYGVTMQDVIDANPALDLKNSSLKKNQIVLIPAELVNTAESADKASAKPEKASSGKAASAKPEKGVKEETADSGEETPEVVVKGDRKYVIHVVKWYEDLSDIAKNYGVSEEEIMKFNGMRSAKLRKKMRLKIPVASDAKEGGEEAAPAKETGTPSEEAAAENTAENVTENTGDEAGNAAEETPGDEAATEDEDGDEPWYKTFFSGKKEVNVSLLLPLNADRTVNENFADFYAGALLAAKDLGGKEGVTIDLNVHDIASWTIPMTRENYDKSDLVIGPVSKKDITSALSVCPSGRYIISPLDPGAAALASTVPNLVQAPTPASFQYRDAVSWAREDLGPEDRVLLIYEKDAKDSAVADCMRAALDSSGLRYQTLSYGILEGRNIDKAMGELLSKDAPNRILLASESEAFVGDVVRNLQLLIHGKYAVILYGPSKIRSFDTIDIESLHNVNLHVSATYFIDYDDARVRDFLMAYRALYNTEPSQFAFQGYDVMDYFVKMYSKYGKNWRKAAMRERKAGLQADYLFTRSGSSLVNGAVRRVTYDPGFSITPIKKTSE